MKKGIYFASREIVNKSLIEIKIEIELTMSSLEIIHLTQGCTPGCFFLAFGYFAYWSILICGNLVALFMLV